MAAQPCTSSSARASDNRIFLFRLQILIIDGGLTVFRNYVDQILTAKSTTLGACLAKENTTITRLRGRGTITQPQYDLLYPSVGNVSTSDLDITLIICLLRNLKCFGLNSKFNWNTKPGQNDLSIEADMYRLKSYRNEMCHISTTTGIQHNDFKNMWSDIKQILLRVNSSSVHPLTDLKQKIKDFKSSPLDSEAEERMKNEIKKWTQNEKAVEVKLELVTKDVKEVKDILGTQTKRQAKTHKRTLKNAKAVKITKSKIAKIEKQMPAGNKITSLNECMDVYVQAVNEEQYQQRKKELKEDLMRFYKWSHSQVPLSPLFEEKDTPLASFYIRPELNVKTLQDMFKTKGVANREVYLKADAGLGKTTFSKYLATSWYQAHCSVEKDLQHFEKNDIDCMRDFDFVFLVLLRDSNTSCSVDELIFKLIVSMLTNSKSFKEEFLEKLMSREKCLVILDGLDEWTHPNRQCERGPRSIPHRNVRENCIILTTTRPWKLGDLNLSSNELGKTVELTKLSRDSAETLIRRTLLRLKSPPHNMSIEIDNATLVHEIFNSRVAHLANVPLLLMYMICLRCEGFKIGNSKCELYVKIIELLLLRTTQKYGDIPQTLSSRGIPACFTEHDKCKEYFPLLVNLGQLAHHTLSNETRENTLVFDGSVTEKYLTPEEIKFTLHSGILSQSTTTKLTKKVSKVSFSHKTVHEFFAAILISSHSDDQQIVLEKCRNVQDILDMSQIFEFLSKMNADRTIAISNDLMSVINEDEKTRDFRTRTGDENWYNNPLKNIQKMFMSCLHEMPESENIQLCLQDFFIDWRTEDSKQLQRLSKQNKTNIKSLYIYIEHKDEFYCLGDIIDLFSLTNLSQIQKLYYYSNKWKLREAEIGRILFPSLQYVTLLRGVWTHDENLSEKLAQLYNLQYLNISYFEMSHIMLETFFNFISSQKIMKELTIEWLLCLERPHDCELILDLSQHSTLTKLKLKWLNRLQLNISTPSLVSVMLSNINLDENCLVLSRDMLNIERVILSRIEIEMCAESFRKIFITVLENLPQSVTVKMSNIKPDTEYKRVKEYIRRSQNFHVIHDGRYALKDWCQLEGRDGDDKHNDNWNSMDNHTKWK